MQRWKRVLHKQMEGAETVGRRSGKQPREGLQKARWRLLALGWADVTSFWGLRSVPGMTSEPSVELGLAATSAALHRM